MPDDEESVEIKAVIPHRLMSIIVPMAHEKNIDFSEFVGKLIVEGVEHQRMNQEEKKNGK